MKNLKKNSFKNFFVFGRIPVKNYFFTDSSYFKEYKNWARQKTARILTNTTNSNFLFIVLPFILNLSQIIFFKYKDQTFSVFLEKNLPGYSSPYEKFFWQTFEYFNYKKLKSLQNYKRVDIYNEFILLETKSISPTFESQMFLAHFPRNKTKSYYLPFKKQEQINYYPNTKSETHSMKGVYQRQKKKWNSASFLGENANDGFELKAHFYLLNPREFFIHSNSLFYNLDQFPLKINNSSSKNENKIENKKYENIKKSFFNNKFKIQSLSKIEKTSFSYPSTTSFSESFQKKFQKTYEIKYNMNDEGDFQKKLKAKPFLFQNQLNTKLKKEKFIYKTISFYNSINFEKKYISKFIVLKNQKLQINSVLPPFVKEGQASMHVKNEKYLNKKINHYFSIFSFFQNEFNNFFYKKLLLPNTRIVKDTKVKSTIVDLQAFFSNFCSENLIQLLNEFDFKEENFILKPRLMSGYFYPDLTKKDVKSYFLELFLKKNNLNKNKILNNFNKNFFYTSSGASRIESPSLAKQLKEGEGYSASSGKTSKIKIFLPLSFYKDNLTASSMQVKEKTNFSTIQLQYKPTFLEGVQYRQILYQGPGVVLDENTKDIFLTNKKQIQNWFKTIFYSDNPLSDRKNSFFGKKNYFSNDIIPSSEGNSVALSPKVTMKGNVLEKNFRLIDKNLNISKDKVLDTSTIYPFIEDYRIPYLEENQWRLILEKLKAESLKTKSFNSLKEQFELLENNQLNISIPLIRIKYPKKKPIIWPLTLLDYYNPKYHKSCRSLSDKSCDQLILNKIPSDNAFASQEGLAFSQARGGAKSQNKLFFDHSSQTFIKNKNYGGIYKKLFSFYPNESFTKLEKTNRNKKDYDDRFLQSLKQLKRFSSEEIFYKENFFFAKKVENAIFNNQNPHIQNLNFEKKNYSAFNKYEMKNRSSHYTNLNFSFLKKPSLSFFEKKELQKILKYFSNSFYQNWESVSFLSFFIIAQFSFGLFILQILQGFYKKYGKELVSYLLDIVSSLGILDEGLKDELQLDDNQKGFRIIYKNQKQFQHIAGIDIILPELGEIVWFLRNSARSFKMGNILPKGILLIGPPGTGKTLLVQAIAGEAEVPVLIQSGSSLNDPDQEGIAAQKLKNLFEKARELAPCIIFIDEIDTLGEKRENIIKNPMGSDEIIESIYEFDSDLKNDSKDSYEKNLFFSNAKIFKTEDLASEGRQENFLNNLEILNEESFSLKSVENTISKNQLKQQQLSLLMQFLVELDGLQSRKGIVVIGATNRPNVLDSALIRPGRFDKVFYLDLPGKEKRIEILKLYSTNLGIQKNLSWDYFANRTFGFSAADLAAVMNESSIQAIIKDSVHTVETIEKGILFITSYSTEKTTLNFDEIKDPFYLTRLAYYQCGKALLHTFLPNHPPAIVVYLWPRPKNARHKKFTRFLQTSFLKISYKSELENRLIGFYAGKASELFSLIRNSSKILMKRIAIQNTSKKIIKPLTYVKIPRSKALTKYEGLNNQKILNLNPAFSFKEKTKDQVQISNQKYFKNFSFSLYWQSDLGFDDLNSATFLTYFMIDKWYFYSKNIIIRKYHEILQTKNNLEIPEMDILEVLNQLTLDTQKNLFQEKKSLNYQQIFEEWSIRSWWQVEIIKQASLSDIFFSDWYRIYLPNPEENDRNEEWISPDQYYHDNDNLVNLLNKSKNSSLIWTNLYSIDRDYISHGLILLSFNKAFSFLNNNREILDYFVDYLLRHEILRQSDIYTLVNKFIMPIPFLKKDQMEAYAFQKLKNILIFEKNWGKNSRKINSHFINFRKFKLNIENKNRKKGF
uniref:Cell division protein n=1 Tax=Interfilum terricola TaxID=163310 RepID=A0A097KPH0_9VIRI|nr:cell division protein [Interfilum terricola]AIT95084.1 cell division protein [Interfilum terricola]